MGCTDLVFNIDGGLSGSGDGGGTLISHVEKMVIELVQIVDEFG